MTVKIPELRGNVSTLENSLVNTSAGLFDSFWKADQKQTILFCDCTNLGYVLALHTPNIKVYKGGFSMAWKTKQINRTPSIIFVGLIARDGIWWWTYLNKQVPELLARF